MQNLSVFLNPVKPESVKFLVSERFRDEDGKTIEWELRAISGAEDRALRQKYTIPAKHKQPQSFDGSGYTTALCASSVVYPNLNDAKLQDCYGVMGAEDLLEKMLLSGEMLRLMAKVQEINGFDIDLKEEAKN